MFKLATVVLLLCASLCNGKIAAPDGLGIAMLPESTQEWYELYCDIEHRQFAEFYTRCEHELAPNVWSTANKCFRLTYDIRSGVEYGSRNAFDTMCSKGEMLWLEFVACYEAEAAKVAVEFVSSDKFWAAIVPCIREKQKIYDYID